MARSARDFVVPILFLVEGAFWAAVVALGGGALLLFAALAGVLSGVLLVAAPSHWVTRPLAGASALFGFTLAAYQTYVAATLLGSNLGTVGEYSSVLFAVFVIVSIYLELETLSMGHETAAATKT